MRAYNFFSFRSFSILSWKVSNYNISSHFKTNSYNQIWPLTLYRAIFSPKVSFLFMKKLKFELKISPELLIMRNSFYHCWKATSLLLTSASYKHPLPTHVTCQGASPPGTPICCPEATWRGKGLMRAYKFFSFRSFSILSWKVSNYNISSHFKTNSYNQIWPLTLYRAIFSPKVSFFSWKNWNLNSKYLQNYL